MHDINKLLDDIKDCTEELNLCHFELKFEDMYAELGRSEALNDMLRASVRLKLHELAESGND